MAVGWSPLGSNSETTLRRRPPSDFSGFGGLTGVKLDSGTNSGRRGPSPSVMAGSGKPSKRRCGRFGESAVLT